MQANRILKRRIQTPYRVFFGFDTRPGARERQAPAALDDPPAGDNQGFSGSDAADAVEYGFVAGGELELQKFRAAVRIDPRRNDAGGDQRLRLGGKSESVRRFGVIKRLDSEGIAGQQQAVCRRIVNRDRVHAAQFLGKTRTEFPIEMKRRLAIGGRDEGNAAHFLPQLDVIVDLGIGDERGVMIVADRLIAGRKIDDRETGMHHAEIAGNIAAASIRSAMGECALQGIEPFRSRRAACGHDSGDSAHQPSTRENSDRYCATTAAWEKWAASADDPPSISRAESGRSPKTRCNAIANASASSTGTSTPFFPS